MVLSSNQEQLLREIVAGVRNYKGIKRKASIGLVLPMFNLRSPNVVASKGEDAAIVRIDGKLLAFAADGIMHELIEKNPWWAGYCSVLVNVNDILAMNALPKAAVNVISVRNENVAMKIIQGICDACAKFDVPMVGGHLHPDAPLDSVSVAILGEVRKNRPLLSNAASPGEKVMMICDLRGRFTPGIPYSWDTSSMKPRKVIKEAIQNLLEALQLFTAGKDISNPGTLGTLAMLLEASGVGAKVDILKIPRPKKINLLQWLNAYQGFGFIGTAREKNVDDIIESLRNSGLSAAAIGEIISEKRLMIRLGKNQRTLFNLSQTKITGLFE